MTSLEKETGEKKQIMEAKKGVMKITPFAFTGYLSISSGA